MTGSVCVRHIADSDWDSIVVLEASAYGECGLSEGRVALESRARTSPATCFVLDIGQQIAGYLLALPYPMFHYPDLTRAEQTSFDSHTLHLHDVVIAGSFRGQGLAKHLLHHLAATARSRMYERISLIAVAGSDTFWSANGYHSHPEVSLPKSYGAEAVYMSRAI